MKHILAFPLLLACFFSFSSSVGLIETKKCPVCKSSKDVIPIVYGKPGTELIQKAERGECRLGGCVIDKDSPRNYCKKDSIPF